MVFTRHFYEQEEVCGALQHCVLNGRVRDALFWIQELTDSEESILCFRTLLETWLLFYGGTFPEWLDAAERSWKGEEMSGLELALNLTLCEKKDISGLNSLILVEEPIERLVSDGSLEGYLVSAISQGRARCAIWAAGTMTKGGDLERIWKVLPSNVFWLRGILKECSAEKYRQLVFALITALCTKKRYSCSKDKIVWSPLKREQTDEIDCWIALLGRRERRKISVPAGQLCGCGPRWRISRHSSNLERLYNFEKSVSSDKEGFWHRALCKGGWNEEKGWNGDDDALEEFYEEYFPDDIPDEWSLEEQKKSHGSGYLREKDEVISGGRWSRSWLSSTWRAAAVWAQDDEVNNKLWNIKINHGFWKALCELSFWEPVNIKKHLTPLRRIYETDQ